MEEVSTSEVATEFALDLVFSIAKKYKMSVTRALEVIDKANYWRVINNDLDCCTLAHDGTDAVINRMQEAINAVLSRN